MATFAPAVFVNHGGGPLPLLGDKEHFELTKFLRDDVRKHVNLKDIKAIILVTAHWEESEVGISSGENHDLYFDYYNYPPESYKYEYDAPGSPDIASKVHDALKKAGIKSNLDDKRGWDHGVFVPMLLINPAADIPIIQVSVLRNQDPAQHYNLGKVLYQFRKEGIAVFGSGMSYHNMIQLRKGRNNGGVVMNKDFDDYINKVCTAEDETKRREGLMNWRQHPGADEAHPPGEADHLMPLIVIAGAGGQSPAERICNFVLREKFKLSSFLWKNE